MVRFSWACVGLLLACAPEYSVQGRAYELLAPKGSDPSTPLPLIIMAHGYGITGQGQDVFFPVSGQVEAKGFLYAMPNGTVDAQGKRFWNATEACCNNQGLAVDDVAFLRALVADVQARRAVKPGHIFLVGHSNGAFMSLRLACEASDLFTGVVAVSGSTWKDAARCPAGQAVPILLVHGDKDSSVPYEGNERYPGARETGRRFAGRNGCTGGWAERERLDLLGNATAETTDSVIDGCATTGAVELWTHEGVGHLPIYDTRWSSRIVDWLEEHAR